MTFLQSTLDYLRDFNIVTIIIRLVTAVIFGGFIGLERERHGRAAGLRTHILVCLGAAITTLIGQFDMVHITGYTGDPMRIGAQVISGIGFLGVGTILSKGRFQVTGLTTAAGLWTTASIGLALGIGFYEGAVIGTLLAVLTMTLLSKFDALVIERSKKFRVYIEIGDVTRINALIEKLESEYNARDLLVTVPRSGVANNAGIEATVKMSKNLSQETVLKNLIESDDILFALPSI